MSKKITSVVINYIDQTLREPGPDCYYRTTINRTDRTLSVKHMKNATSMYWETILPAESDRIEKFFGLIESAAWEEDYSVMVCDGFIWSMTLKSGRKTVRKIIGTVDAPEVMRELTELIYSMIDDQQCLDFPLLFGYVPQPEG